MANPLPSWPSDSRSNVQASVESTLSSSNSVLSASVAPFSSHQGLEWAAASRESFTRAVDAARGGAESASQSLEWGSPSVQNMRFSASFAKEGVGFPCVQNMPLLAMGAGSISQEDAGSPSVQNVPFKAMGARVSYAMEDAGSQSGQSMPYVPMRNGSSPKEEVVSPSEVQNMPFGPMQSETFGKADVGMAAGEAAMNSAAPPPFLTKTFDMVEDPYCNSIVSWGPANNSFIVWDPHAFSRELLPRVFKHSNFSSFVRQLNTYGFRKVDPNRWEFASEGFLRGQKHLLKGIQRRKPVSTTTEQQLLLAAGGPCLDFGKYAGVQGEIEGLRRDKNFLMSEVVRLRQQQQSTQQQISFLLQRLQTTEHKQQQITTLLAKAMHHPSFMAQLMQKNERAKCLETTRKRHLPSAGSSNVQDGGDTASSEVLEDGQLPDYNASPSNMKEVLQALLQEMERNQFSSEVGGEAIAAMQDGFKVLTTQQHDGGKGERVAQNAVKVEIPDGFEDHPSATSTVHRGRSVEHGDRDVFWERLLHVQKQMVATSANRGSIISINLG